MSIRLPAIPAPCERVGLLVAQINALPAQFGSHDVDASLDIGEPFCM
jgi:hypothetical protein